MRKVEVVRVPDGFGRDAGKYFKIREWPALRGEKWAWRFALCVKGTTAQLAPGIERLGMLGITRAMINGILAADVDEAKLIPLLDELLECVQIVRSINAPDINDPVEPMNPAGAKHPLGEPIVLDGDIEEVRTVAWLRSEVLRVHINFSIADGLSALLREAASASNSPTTQTSLPQ